ncbi:hypothetical protein F5Y16DRAFT_377700 [Xylariaceae sp. FL0255]|nr:hypothetical protein F5Y16DRAFT_377700 [Xylariaceae sp. FL0255]
MPKSTLITLSKSEDFRVWRNAFIQQAVSLALWTYIDPSYRQPWPIEPTKPSVRSYPKTASRVGTRGSSFTIDPEEIDLDSTPANAIEMTPTGRIQYNLDVQEYRYEYRVWEIYISNKHKLVEWM